MTSFPFLSALKEIVYNGHIFQIDPANPTRRFNPRTPKAKTSPPALPPAAVSSTEIVSSAAKAGEGEGRRLRRKTSRRATRTASQQIAFQPARTQAAGLSANLAGTS